MIKKEILLAILLFFTSHGQSQRLIYDENIPVEKLRVVLEEAKGGLVSEMLTDLEYIPLQGGKSDLVDYIYEIVFHKGKIGVLGANEGYFHLYHEDGRFINKITKIDGYKPHPNSGNALFNFIDVAEDKLELSSSDFTARVDLLGNIVDTVHQGKAFYASEDDGFGQYLKKEVTIENTNYKLYGTYQDDERIKQDVLLMNGIPIVQYDPLDTIKTYMINDDLSKVHNGKSYMTVGYNTKIFQLSASGIDKIYEIVLPARNTFDLKNAPQLKQADYSKGYQYFAENNLIVSSLSQVSPYRDYLLFRAIRNHNPMWLVYNLKTKEVLSLNNIIPDRSNDYLNFFDVRKIFVQDDFLYSIIYTSDIREAKEKCLVEGHTMRKEYADLEKYNNPILVRFKLK